MTDSTGGIVVADAVRFVSVTTSGTGLMYVHSDHLGTPQKMTNESQALVWDAVYEPFGEVHSLTGTASNNQRFPGQYVDQESAFAYNYFRDYDSSTGRYVQSDPIGLEGGLNTYAYVLNNPIIYDDPSGLAVPVFIRLGALAIKACKKIPSCKRELAKLEKQAKDLCKKVSCVLRRDPAHHNFSGFGYCEHYQFDCKIKKSGLAKDPQFTLRIPIPGTCGPNRRTDPHQ